MQTDGGNGKASRKIERNKRLMLRAIHARGGEIRSLSRLALMVLDMSYSTAYLYLTRLEEDGAVDVKRKGRGAPMVIRCTESVTDAP